MGKGNEPLVGQCVYCGKTAERHDDHVPPECIFPKPKPAELITVPCCRLYNKSFEKDDEYFKTSIALCLDAHDDPRLEQVIDSSIRALSRKGRDAYRALFLSAAQRVMVRSTGSLFVPTLIFTVDVDRFERFGRRLVKGLYYSETGQRLPETCEVESLVNDVPFELDLMSLLLRQPAKIIDPNVFAYRCRIDPDDPRWSAWILAFYGRFFIGGRTKLVPQL